MPLPFLNFANSVNLDNIISIVNIVKIFIEDFYQDICQIAKTVAKVIVQIGFQIFSMLHLAHLFCQFWYFLCFTKLTPQQNLKNRRNFESDIYVWKESDSQGLTLEFGQHSQFS